MRREAGLSDRLKVSRICNGRCRIPGRSRSIRTCVQSWTAELRSQEWPVLYYERTAGIDSKVGFQIRFTEAALVDLEEILSYSWANFPSTSEQFGTALLNHLDVLKDGLNARFQMFRKVFGRPLPHGRGAACGR